MNSNKKLKKDKVILLIIDPQNDFHEGGSLEVPNSKQDSERITKMIK
jgi:nicotinamidase-related amidase